MRHFSTAFAVTGLVLGLVVGCGSSSSSSSSGTGRSTSNDGGGTAGAGTGGTAGTGTGGTAGSVGAGTGGAAGTGTGTGGTGTAGSSGTGGTAGSSTNVIDSLQPGHWLELPNTNLSQAFPAVTPAGNNGSKSVVDSWSGGAYDTKRDRLIVWGGGHGDYSGNEIYTFDVNSLAWSRITEPASLTGWTQGMTDYADGTPVSRHTYNYIDYIPPPVDKFVVVGGAGLWQDGQQSDKSIHLFDFDTLSWTEIPDMVTTPTIGCIVAFDPVTGDIWHHGAGGGVYLSSFDPVAKTWTTHGNMWTENVGWFKYAWTAAIDPIRREFVTIGGGNAYVWDIGQAGDIKSSKLSMTGDVEILDAQDPGFAYDPTVKAFIAWNGGSYVYKVDVGASTITKIPAASTNAVTPSSPNSNGTYGRFRYVPSKNVFILVNRASENVYVYKRTL